MEENLKELIRLFYEDKKELEKYKKSVDEYNKDIKDGMNELGIDNFQTDKLNAKITVSKRESFNEDLLLATIKELGVENVIKTKEYVDMDELEDAIYNGRLHASKLTPCKIVKEIVTLKVTPLKI